MTAAPTDANLSRVPAGPVAVPAVLGLLTAAVIAAVARWGPDWPAQEFRAWSARYNGLTAWTNNWYSGQALPGYSVLYPAVSSTLGAALTGLLAVVATTAAASRLTPEGSRFVRGGFQTSVAVVLAADLLIGQVPYLLGVAFGAWAVVAIRSGRPWAAAAAAAACSLASPLAGAFLLMTVPAVAIALGRWQRAAPFLAASTGIVVSVIYGGGEGPFPFVGSGFVWTVLFAGAGLALGRAAGMRSIQVLAATYGVVAFGAFLVPNPIGGNAARFGQLVALPLLWHLIPRLRWLTGRMIAVLVTLATMWPVLPAVGSAVRGADDPSQAHTYYRGLLGFLHTQDVRAGRAEVVFSREHWESLYVARAFPIARGWERQTDLDANAVLYAPLTATTYRRWLDDNAVSLVVLPATPIDFGGVAEAALLRHAPSYLVPVWHDAHFQVWKVRNARPIVSGPARLTSVGTASLSLDFARAGQATVRIRSSSMWAVTTGEGCITSDRQGWLVVTAAAPGPVTARARVGVGGFGPDPRCS